MRFVFSISVSLSLSVCLPLLFNKKHTVADALFSSLTRTHPKYGTHEKNVASAYYLLFVLCDTHSVLYTWCAYLFDAVLLWMTHSASMQWQQHIEWF